MDSRTIRQIIGRLERLERAVFSDGSISQEKRHQAGQKGPTVGIRLLLSKGFFQATKNLGQVRDALSERGYHYSTQAVDTALRRLARPDGPLVVLKQAGRNLYVNRK